MQMSAKLKPRIDLHDREELKDALPLRTPYVVYIDPCDTCNFHCKFCPSGDGALLKKTTGRGHGPMDFGLYKVLIDGMGDFKDKIKVIRLYKDGEPLLNPHFPEMVRYAKESGFCERVDTTTNASLLTPELSLQIIDAGLDRINISIEGVNAAQYQDFSRYNIDYDTFVKNITFFYEHRKQCEMNIKINGDILTEAQEQQFYATFGNITDGISVEHIIDYWPKFKQDKVTVNEAVGLLGNEIKEVCVCPYVFYEMAINSDGSYSLCRFDWNHSMLLGRELDVFSSPRRVWDSTLLWEFQNMFLRGERTSRAYLLCAKCGLLKQGSPEDIDEFSQLLLDRM
ncbi:MAG: radical SAM/SPASM domain-containing protein [Lachnospiraceae bacterium]|nr:radical SAM/SPASM domain-containing protein [Lachnospiraceae bacterium]